MAKNNDNKPKLPFSEDDEDAQRAFEESYEMSDDNPTFELGYVVMDGPNGQVKYQLTPDEMDRFKKDPRKFIEDLQKSPKFKPTPWQRLLQYPKFPIYGGRFVMFMINIMDNTDTESTAFMEIYQNPFVKDEDMDTSLLELMNSENIFNYISFCLAWEYGLKLIDYHDMSMKMIVDDKPDKKSMKISVIAHCDRRPIDCIYDTMPLDWISTAEDTVCLESKALKLNYHVQYTQVKHIYEPVVGVEAIIAAGALDNIDFMNTVEDLNLEQIYADMCLPLLVRAATSLYYPGCASSMPSVISLKHVHLPIEVEKTEKLLKITVYALPGYLTNDTHDCLNIIYRGSREIYANSRIENHIDSNLHPYKMPVHWMNLCSSRYSQIFTLVGLNQGTSIVNGDGIIPVHFYEALFLFGINLSKEGRDTWLDCGIKDDDGNYRYTAISDCSMHVITVAKDIAITVWTPEEPAYLAANPVKPKGDKAIQILGFVDCQNKAIASSTATINSEVFRSMLNDVVKGYMSVPTVIDPKEWNPKENAYVLDCYRSEDIIRFAIFTDIPDPFKTKETSEPTTNTQ